MGNEERKQRVRASPSCVFLITIISSSSCSTEPV